ncbi:hypothetical protein BD779DRAFT_1676013 [Infundibulicybe gibba]|nr:hypothetical protein BD779DRAFT_1676013 [Infundibulicybe gibba]
MLPSTSKLALAFIPLLLVCKAAVALPQPGQPDSSLACSTGNDCKLPLSNDPCCQVPAMVQ